MNAKVTAEKKISTAAKMVDRKTNKGGCRREEREGNKG
jgi:hypothetical protein